MKLLSCFLLLLACVGGSALADIAPPRPCSFVARNLDAFPEYHFVYRFAYDKETSTKAFRSIKAGETYRFGYDVKLFVQKGTGPYVSFRTLQTQYDGGYGFDFTVNKVEGEAEHIKVQFTDQPVKKKSASNDTSAPAPGRSVLPYFLLGGSSLAALVLRRRSWAA